MSGGSFALRGPPLLPARIPTSSSSASDSAFASSGDGADGVDGASARSTGGGHNGHAAGASAVAAVREPRPGGRPKRTLIESACAACRRRKSRCDGIRPACSRCQNLRTECAYEAEEGESRWSALRRRNQLLENERAELRELMSFVQTRPEAEAQEIFARIRLGGYDDVFNLLRQVKEGEVSAAASRSSTPTRATLNLALAEQQRLPPIRTMFDVSGPAHLPPANPMAANHPPPPLLTPEHSRGSTSSGTSNDYSKPRPL